MTHRQLLSYIGVFLLIITAIWFGFQKYPLVEVFDKLTVEMFIDESGIVHDSGKFFSN